MTNPDQMLRDALLLLRKEFPDAVLLEARLEFRLGERSDLGAAQTWKDVSWTIQVNNDHESADSLEGALADLRVRLDHKAKIPSLAERVAAVLRDIPDEGFERENVIMAARAILDEERRGR